MKKNGFPTFFPVLINLKKFPCLVIGGGEAARRKVISLKEFNADITVLSPRICRQLKELAGKNEIKIIKKSYSREYIKNFKFVFCTTDNKETNKIIYKDCTEESILINVADDPSLCDFILPANIKRGDLTISVSSQGQAPFYTKEMKKKLNSFIPPVYTDIIELAGIFRKELLSGKKAKSAKEKSKMFKKFTSTDWEKILSENGVKNPRYYVKKILREN